jgi:hypothetical protein
MTTTWNASAADPKRAIARADAVALLNNPGVALAIFWAGTDPHQCNLSHFRFSAEVTNRQKCEDFHSRQPSPISLTQPSGTIATPQVTP